MPGKKTEKRQTRDKALATKNKPPKRQKLQAKADEPDHAPMMASKPKAQAPTPKPAPKKDRVFLKARRKAAKPAPKQAAGGGGGAAAAPEQDPSQMVASAGVVEVVAEVGFATNAKSKKGYVLKRRASAGNLGDLEDAVCARFMTNTLKTRNAEFLRVVLWNIQDFGGGPSGAWPSVDQPANDAYTKWLNAYPAVAGIEMPSLASRPKRRKALVKELKAKGVDHSDNAVIDYHEQVLHVCALADHIATLNFDILIALEVKQRASPPATATKLDSKGWAAIKIFFLYGVWSAIKKLPEVQEGILNEIGFARAANGDKLVNTTKAQGLNKKTHHCIDEKQAENLAAAYRDGRNYWAGLGDEEASATLHEAFSDAVEIPTVEDDPQVAGAAKPKAKTATDKSDEALDEFLPDDNFFLLLACLFSRRTVDSKKNIITKSYNYQILPTKSIGTVNSLTRAIEKDALDEFDFETKNIEELIASMKGLWNAMMRGRSLSQVCKAVLTPPLPVSTKDYAFESLVAVLNKRLSEQGQPKLKVILKPKDFNGAEALGFATTQECAVDEDNIKLHVFKDAATYQRPLHVIPVTKGGLKAHIIAGHAPAPNHWTVGKAKALNQKVVSWFEEANRIGEVLGKGGEPVLFAGDLNITGKNAKGLGLLDAAWLPNSGEHGNIKTSYVRTKKKGGGASKWSEAYDKVLLLGASTQAASYSLTWMRDTRWDSFSDARKYSDHSFIVANLEKVAGKGKFQFIEPT